MLERQVAIQGAERAVLIGIALQEKGSEEVKEHLEELSLLAQTAGAVTVATFYQLRSTADRRTFIGKGKLAEIADFISKHNIHTALFDNDLTASQINNIQSILKCKVIDRTTLILDIFARRARTLQATVQVELAQYQYLLPRLKGLWTHLERQGGGIGTRGPGEAEIETDRRIVQRKISALKKQLVAISTQAASQRKQRNAFIRVALVGYTNAGKSTLMRQLSKSEVLVENKLFATLDTTTRKVFMDHTPFLLSDTVGFIRKLPHHLVESFKSTLEEVRESDILLHIVDLSHPKYEAHISVVIHTLASLGSAEKPMILVLNKADAYRSIHFDKWTELDVTHSLLASIKHRWGREMNTPCILLTATEKESLSSLKAVLLPMVRSLYAVKYPCKTQYFY